MTIRQSQTTQLRIIVITIMIMTMVIRIILKLITMMMMLFKMRNPEIKYIPVRIYVKHLSDKTKICKMNWFN